jgi:hypothetical protein
MVEVGASTPKTSLSRTTVALAAPNATTRIPRLLATSCIAAAEVVVDEDDFVDVGENARDRLGHSLGDRERDYCLA